MTADPATNLLGLTFDELAARAKAVLPAGAGAAARLYAMAFRDGRLATDRLPLAEANRAAWQGAFAVGVPAVARTVDEPGPLGVTAKAWLRLADGRQAEVVRIPMRVRAQPQAARGSAGGAIRGRAAPGVDTTPGTAGAGAGEAGASAGGGRGHWESREEHTLCISSQVGCRMGCAFCETGRMGLVRQLTAAEIVGQVVAARVHLGWQPRNLVFMGMGEPLDNAANVVQALRVLADKRGLHYSHERLTVCTSGHLDGLDELAKLGWKRLNLSLSLNAADDALRDRLMPPNRRWPLAAVQRRLAEWPQRANFCLGVNWCLIPGINDRPEDARAIAAFCRPLGRVLVNLIPYNPGSVPLAGAPDEAGIVRFVGLLREAGVAVRRRVTKGRSIMAACGQLGDPSARRLHGEEGQCA